MSNNENLPLRSAVIAHALSHPIRVEILTMLLGQTLTVSEITENLVRPQANISQHLAVLREVHLVESNRDGMNVYYQVTTSAVEPLLEALARLAKRIPADEVILRGRGRRRGRGKGRRHGKRRQNQRER